MSQEKRLGAERAKRRALRRYRQSLRAMPRWVSPWAGPAPSRAHGGA